MTKPSNPGRSKNRNLDKSPRVKIDLHAMVALIDPPIPLLGPHLEYRLTRFEEGGTLGYREHEESVRVWDFDIKDRMMVGAGLVPRVKKLLIDHGYQVTVTDHRVFGERFAIDRKLLRAAAGEERQVLDAVQREPLGQIEVRNVGDMVAKMRSIIRMHPKARVLIPLATKTMARKIRWKIIEEEMDRDVHLFYGTWPKSHCRCMVCHFEALFTWRPEDWDIVLLADPLGAVGDVSVRLMAELHGHIDRPTHRVYGFVEPGMRLGRRGRLRLEVLAGSVIHRLGAENVGVRVLWLPTPHGPKIDKETTALAFKRKAYWRNTNRNDFIAAVARAFVSHDAGKLGEYGVPFWGYEPALRHEPNTKIAVLVASTEQAREMAKRLPEWKVVNCVPNNDAGKVESTDADMTGTQGTIITETAAGKDGTEGLADVVIRAGGGTGKLCFTDFPPALDNDARNAILVDFTDDFNERAVQDAKRRQREYDLLGWESEPEPS